LGLFGFALVSCGFRFWAAFFLETVTMTKDLKDLELPRLLYKGPDDSNREAADPLGVPVDKLVREAEENARLRREERERLEQPTQTVRVETREDLEAKLKDGWRLHRTIDKAEAAAAEKARHEAEDIAAEAEAAHTTVEAIAQAHDAKAAKKK
jgi:hypothetical protein